MNNKLFGDDIKLIKQQIIFRKNYGEVINFMINQLGLTRQEAVAEYDRLVVLIHGEQKNVRYE